MILNFLQLFSADITITSLDYLVYDCKKKDRHVNTIYTSPVIRYTSPGIHSVHIVLTSS